MLRNRPSLISDRDFANKRLLLNQFQAQSSGLQNTAT